MRTAVDLDTLSNEQLKAMIHARGEAIRQFIGADNGFSVKVHTKTLTGKDVEQMMTFKQNVLLEMSFREEAIIAGQSSPAMN